MIIESSILIICALIAALVFALGVTISIGNINININSNNRKKD